MNSQSTSSTQATRKFLRQKELLEQVLPFSASTLWRKVRQGNFPQPIRLGPAITAWRVSEIEKWLADQEVRP
jgi:prophage regulatory protein